MRYLLDTCVFLWWGEDKNPSSIKEICETEKNDLYLSAASAFELGIKISRGQLGGEIWESLGLATELPIHHHHARRLALLPPHHKDPFDRMLIAQAMEEALTILTPDPMFRKYDVQVKWD